MPTKHLTLIGVGLIGGSIGLAVRRLGLDWHVTGLVDRAEAVPPAIKFAAVDAATSDLRSAVADADLVILCTPIGQFESLLKRVGPLLKPGAIATDVGSTKRSVAAWATVLPTTAFFVGSHPMAGGEKHGVRNARADLFHGAICAVTPEETTNPAAVNTVREFWRLLGMKTIEMSPATHDALVARSSHLPHALAAALVTLQDAGSLSLAGRGLLDTTRIAAGDPAVWRDILLDNQDNVLNAVEKFSNALATLTTILRAKDADRLTQWLHWASQQRQGFPDRLV